MNSPVTLDLNGAVVVRAKSGEQSSVTDLVLRNSRRQGEELKVSSNREYVRRAIQLGFRELHFRDADAPAFCRDDRRTYFWAVLGKEAVLKPDASATRIESPSVGRTACVATTKPATSPSQQSPIPDPIRNRLNMPTPTTNRLQQSTTDTSVANGKSLATLIDEGEQGTTNMPLRLNIGLSKKVGLPDYGSLGASANLELELDSGAVSDPDRLRQQVRYLFGLAKASVEEELNQQQAALPHTPTNGHSPAVSTNGNGHHHASSNGHRPAGRSNGRAATASQVRAIKTIASRQRLNLAAQLEPFGVQAVEDLSIQQASQMIDELKAEPVGAGGSR